MKDNIKLRALTRADIQKTFNWHNQKEIKEYYSGHPFPINIENEEVWYTKILTSNIPITVFGIEKTDDNKLIGLTILKNIDLINRNCEIAIYIGDQTERKKGYALFAFKETLKFAFYSLGIERVYLKVLEENKAAIKLYDKCNMKLEGILRCSIYKNNEYKNEIIYSLLKNEYE